MGVFWDLLQQDELEKQQQADNIEDRVTHLELELEKTRALLKKTLVALEEHLNKDIDGDGQTG